MLHAVGSQVHLPRAIAVALASHMPSAGLLAATAVKWRGQAHTQMRTFLVTMAGDGRIWRDVAKYAEVPVLADGDSLDEGLPAYDHNESDGSAGDATLDGGWSSDSDQGREATHEDPTTVVFPECVEFPTKGGKQVSNVFTFLRIGVNWCLMCLMFHRGG